MQNDIALIQKKINRTFKRILEPQLLKEIAQCCTHNTFEAGEILTDIGEHITHIPIIQDGLIKVMQENQNEDELFLYFLKKGHICLIPFAKNLNKNTSSMVRVITEEDTECFFIPTGKIDEWMLKYQSWREYIIDSYHNRMLELANIIKSLAFTNLDGRLEAYLNHQVKIKKSSSLNLSHQDIANDLHTSRVVISRLLKSLENDGKIKLGRNRIQVSC